MRNLIAWVACLFLAGSVYASPISSNNDRPVTIGSPSSGEDSVQTILTSGFTGQDATTDQRSAGYFKLSNGFSSVTAPHFTVKNDPSATLGIFSLEGLNDANTIVEYEIFGSGAAEGWTSKITWTGKETGFIKVFNGADVQQSNTAFTGIDRNGFGFYATSGQNKHYTLDGLNNGEAKILAYGSGDSWAFFIETDWDREEDFNDALLYTESLAPVPEPGSFLLIGAGVLAAIAIRRRRQA